MSIRSIIKHAVHGALCAAALVTSQAHAQSICFPEPIALPWLSGPPQWFTPPAGVPSTGLRTDLNEPRWGAGLPTPFFNDAGNQATNEGSFRLVRSGTDLYISVQNKSGDTASIADSVFLSIYVPGSGRGVAVQIPVNPGASNPSSTSSNNVQDYALSQGQPGDNGVPAGTWYSLNRVPSWIMAGSIGTWTKQAGQPVEEGGADWAVQWVVRLGSLGINASSDFRLFMGMRKVMEGTEGGGQGPVAPVVTAPAVSGNPARILDTWIPSNTSLWLATDSADPARLIPKLGASCPNGVAFTSSLQIGTRNADDAAINTSQTCNGSPCVNRFFAQPELNGASVLPNQLRARFRIANWGAEVEQRFNAPWVTIPNGSAVPNNASGLFEFACPANAGGRVCGNATTGLPVPADAHQCMMVELSNAPGSNVPIRTPVVYRNMRFESLSTKELDAEINIKGLQAYTGQAADRDVYMAVATRNMPPIGNWPMFLDSQLLNWLKQLAVGILHELNPFGQNLSLEDQMKIAWPTYEVHSYYDTLRTWTHRGVKYRVFSPMNSFGYYFSHAGIFYGYTHTLGGRDVSRVPNREIYKVRVPNEGVKTIRSGVRTEDLPAFLVNTIDLACRVFPFCARPQ